ncbi:MAG: c-type cytochrome [Steroidobacteraceae bacterium]|jgi:cytochrome c553
MKTQSKTILATLASAAMALMAATTAVAQEAVPAVTPAAAEEAEYLAYSKCQLCHGPQGHSISPIYPALAGQKAWYILEQLQAFRAQTRRDPYARGMMWGIASNMSDTQMVALADYFSKQTPFASPPAPFVNVSDLVARGKSVYSEGVPANGVAPCSACHQSDAGGSDQFPRLAGQHAAYLIKQLIALRSGSREQVVMNGIAAPLQDADLKAVSFYLESLH